MKPFNPAFFALLLCSVFLHAQTGPTPIRLKTGVVATSEGLLRKKQGSVNWTRTIYGGHHYVILQFTNLPDEATKTSLAGNGVRLFNYLSGNAFLAELPTSFDPSAMPATSLREIFPLKDGGKISPAISAASLDHPAPEELLAVSWFGAMGKEVVTKEITATGAHLVNTKLQPRRVVFVQATFPVLTRLAHLPFVAYIEPIRLKDIPLNNNNRAIHGVDALGYTAGRNLQGQNTVIGIGDDADPSSHVDFTGRLILRTSEPIDVHGTHTSGTIAGGGILNPRFKGMAPRARLVVNGFSNIIIDAPTYVNDYNMVASSNSYYDGANGCPGEGEYDALANYLDDESQALPTLLTVFASGNDGLVTCSPFSIGYNTVKSGFQCSKDALTVGANDNNTYLLRSSSSRGPVADGRVKPEVVCSGQSITSTIPYNAYGTLSGTSMAAPTASGIAGLLYQRYRQLHGGSTPSAALIKAVMCNTAVDFGNPGPDFLYGFGMVNAHAAVECLENNHFATGTLANGGSNAFTIPAIPAGVQQVKVMLYWPDPPAAPFVTKSLVNDLDITVTDGAGTLHHPLILDPSAGNAGNAAVEGTDRVNNIEQIVINNPPAGNLSVALSGFSVPQGPQPYVVTYEILSPSVTVEYPFGGETLVSGETETLRWSAYGGDPNPFTAEYSEDGGSTWTLLSNSIPATSRSFVWTVPAAQTVQGVIRITRNGTTYTDINHASFVVSGQPTVTISNPCRGYAQLQWNSIPGATRYEVVQLKADTMSVIGSTTDTSYLVPGLNKNGVYWFGVQAIIGTAAGRRSLSVTIQPSGGACAATNLSNDLSVDALVAPVTGRQFTPSQLGPLQIRMLVRNPGSVSTSSPIVFSYQVNSGAVVSETFGGSLPPNFTGTYTFSLANSYDFSAIGSYQVKVWMHYAADTIPANDTLTAMVKQLRNDPVILSPSFTEGFESALPQAYMSNQLGLDSIDRADFSTTSSRGRLNTFFNSGFPRSGNRAATLDVADVGSSVTDSLITTYNLAAFAPTDQLWLDLYYKKQSPLANNGGNQIWIRGTQTAAWIPVKNLSNASDPLDVYNLVNLDITGILGSAVPAQAVSSSFQVKCGYQGSAPAVSPNPGADPGAGVSFDDIMITKSTQDAALFKLVSPALNGACNLGNAEPVQVQLKNYSTDTLFNVNISFASNGDTVTEMIPFLVPHDTVVYTFTHTADLSAFQHYVVRAWVSSPGDNYHNNDSSSILQFQTTPVINSFPYLEGFEANNGYWYTDGINDSWAWGKPAKTIINRAANGNNAWVTNLNGNYNDNEYSFLYSPCFDLSGLTRPVLSFSHIFQTEDACSCDFHWVEYSLNDTLWTTLGTAAAGINWFDNASVKAWQLSDPRWHVSSFDIPVNAAKIRFRITMYSDPGTNYEGVGIDDIHVFDKAPVFADSSLLTGITQSISGNTWNDVELNGQRIASIQPNGQDLGSTRFQLFIDPGPIRDTAGQDYGARSLVISPANQPAQPVSVRFYFTDSEAQRLIFDTTCAVCTRTFDPYLSGITQYSSTATGEEDSTLRNNLTGNYLYHPAQQQVHIIPYDNGYYAEYSVTSFSEFWINAGGLRNDHPLSAWLRDFTALRSGTTGVLTWHSWQDIGALNYEIQRSTDSLHFTAIGSVPSLGLPDSVTAYTFTDPKLLVGNDYYRLALGYANGDTLYSPVQKLALDAPATSNPVFAVYPNPTTDLLHISTPVNCRYLRLYDITGRLLYSEPASGVLQTLSLQEFARGVYLLKVDTDQEIRLIKVERR